MRWLGPIACLLLVGCAKETSEDRPAPAVNPTQTKADLEPPTSGAKVPLARPMLTRRPPWDCRRVAEDDLQYLGRVGDDEEEPLKEGASADMASMSETRMVLDRFKARAHDVTGDGKLDLLFEFECPSNDDCGAGLFVECQADEDGSSRYANVFSSITMPTLAKGSSGPTGTQWRNLEATVEKDECELRGLFKFDGQIYRMASQLDKKCSTSRP